MAEEKKGLIEEFKEFISRGNVMDMAVGVIIGGAFTGIVTSLTDDIINPLITLITGGNGTEIGGLNFNGVDVGKFLSAVINFLIVAACDAE
jgi:large conductance mechanosensitive channel